MFFKGAFCCFFIFIANSIFNTESKSTRQSVENFHVNATAMTITSFNFHPIGIHPSTWIDRILGSKSVFYSKHAGKGFLNRAKLSEEELILRSAYIKKAFQIPESHIWPSCYVEMLGFVRIDSAAPFLSRSRQERPIVGRARLGEL
jgi:hypothetical protein